jgi:hypothetical protein
MDARQFIAVEVYSGIDTRERDPTARIGDVLSLSWADGPPISSKVPPPSAVDTSSFLKRPASFLKGPARPRQRDLDGKRTPSPQLSPSDLDS